MAVAPALAYRPPRLARKSIRRAALIWCFLAPSLAIFLLYRIIPLLWNVALSFSGGVVIGVADTDGVSLGGQTTGGAAGRFDATAGNLTVNGGAGVHYYFN